MLYSNALEVLLPLFLKKNQKHNILHKTLKFNPKFIRCNRNPKLWAFDYFLTILNNCDNIEWRNEVTQNLCKFVELCDPIGVRFQLRVLRKDQVKNFGGRTVLINKSLVSTRLLFTTILKPFFPLQPLNLYYVREPREIYMFVHLMKFYVLLRLR